MANKNSSFSWQAPEFRKYNRPFWWYILLAAFVVLLSGYQLYRGDKFGAFTYVIIGVLVIFVVSLKPRDITITINKDGITTDSKTYPFGKFKYFWIVDDGHHRTLNLEANTYVSQTIIIELMDQDIDEIREFLSVRIPEAEGLAASFSQKASRRLRL